MKCAYCGKEIEYDAYQGSEGQRFEVKIGDIPVEAEFHNECLCKLMGEYLTEKVRWKVQE